MAFSRDDLVAYEAKPQVEVPNHDPWGNGSKPLDAEPQVEAAAPSESSAEVVTEPTDTGTDGSNTEITAESVTATDAIPEGENTPELEEIADGKPRSRAQERIEELVAERNALRKYGEYLLSQVGDLRKSGTKEPVQESRPAPVVAVDETAPTLESADFDPIKLNKLQNEWIQKQVDKRVESAIQQIEVRQSETSIRQAFETRVSAFRKTAPDFDTVLANPALPQLAPEAARIVVKSEQGPDIAYYLGKNPDIAERIARLDSNDQIAAVGRLAGQLSKTTQKEPSSVTKPPVKVASVTKAPPPPKPVSSGSGPITKDMAQMTMDEWVNHERGRKIAERTAKQKLRLSMR